MTVESAAAAALAAVAVYVTEVLRARRESRRREQGLVRTRQADRINDLRVRAREAADEAAIERETWKSIERARAPDSERPPPTAGPL